MENLVSIIVPVFNASKTIEQCLSSLVNLDYPKDKFEIIVVDNGSIDSTVKIIQKFPVRLFTKTNCTISALRNLGAKQATGDILAFIDADCVASQNWLKDALEFISKEGVGAVGCWYDLPGKTSLIEKAWDTHMSHRRTAIGSIDWIPSGNLIIYRFLFEKISGFDESLATSEDVDICERIIKTGFSIYSHPLISVAHLGNPKTIKEFFIKEKWRGVGVLHNFLRGFPNLKFNKAIMFTLVMLISLVSAIAGIAAWKFYGNKTLFILSIAGIFSIPLWLSAKTMINSKKWQYSLPLFLLFIAFGFSRVFSFFSFKRDARC